MKNRTSEIKSLTECCSVAGLRFTIASNNHISIAPSLCPMLLRLLSSLKSDGNPPSLIGHICIDDLHFKMKLLLGLVDKILGTKISFWGYRSAKNWSTEEETLDEDDDNNQRQLLGSLELGHVHQIPVLPPVELLRSCASDPCTSSWRAP
jgi:hypothetical protein